LIGIRKDNNFPQLKKRFSKFQSRGFSKRLGRDVPSAVENGIGNSSNILGTQLTSSPLESVSNSQEVNKSSYRLRRNQELNRTSSSDASENPTNEKEKVEKKKYKVHGLESIKDVFKSAIEDDIKKEQSVEYESPEEKGRLLFILLRFK